MQHFTEIKNATSKQFETFKDTQLFCSKATKGELQQTYLSSFPPGTNPVFRERTEHDCNCCLQYIFSLGNVLAVVDGKLTSVWDINIGGHYQVVADAMHELVTSKGVDSVFVYDKPSAGTDFNLEQAETGVIRWDHFYDVIPRECVADLSEIETIKGQARTHYQTLKRSVTELQLSAVEIVLDLISQNSIYRGKEHTRTVNTLKKCIQEYSLSHDKDAYLWMTSTKLKGVSAFKNTVIGSLIEDISNGIDLQKAVDSFEEKVAPSNYKRTSGVFTEAMRVEAEKTAIRLNIMPSLQRRYATIEDITINNVLFADRSAKKEMGVFDLISSEATTKAPSLDKVDEMSIDNFITTVLPGANSIEVMLENEHLSNLSSLIAPSDPTSNNILKWNNNFSWSYDGEVTDSIKQRVKAAGGNVNADFRSSLLWFNGDDLDLSIEQPNGETIYFSNPKCLATGGNLDVDMNAHQINDKDPVENIVYPERRRMKEGIYQLRVHNFKKCSSVRPGFEVEIEFDGKLVSFVYDKTVRNNQSILVAKFKYSHKDGITFIETIPSSERKQEKWNIQTQQFHKVSVMMLSPNYWDDQQTGNKHYFFMLENCRNPDQARGFYNEFLREELTPHRKVFEVLGSKLKTPVADNQLSGLGFSSTQRNHLYCRVSGSFNRMLKITF